MNFPSYLDSLIRTLAETLPGVFGAITVLIVGWIIALIFKKIVYRLMLKTDWDERLLGNTIVDTNKFLANLVYHHHGDSSSYCARNDGCELCS
ncbi:MAG: hypothetical protein O2887_06335 [Bacteroidetes bacterium]|nr:hypothetical protein [Bacteroidota bacterium]MDA1120100.1 hypothetical protein [Bacteroidota bacterium]